MKPRPAPRAAVQRFGAAYGTATLASLLLVVACGGAAPPPPSEASPLLGRSVPTFRRAALSGELVDSGAWRGRVVVVDFFARSCAPCQVTLPVAEAVHRDQPDVVFVGVSEDETIGDAQEVIARHGLTFSVLHDRGSVLAGRFRVSGLPTTFVIAGDGTVRWVGGLERGDDALARAVRAAR